LLGVLGLVRGLVEWVPTSAAWAGYVAGPLVLMGYLVGSVPFGDLVAARRFRRQLDTFAPDRLAGSRFTDLDATQVITGSLAAGTTLLVATLAWDVGLQAAPRGSFGAIGTYANQALGAWVSIGLWTGTAALLGSVAPAWTGFKRGGSGVGPALALLVVYMPLLAAVALAAGSLTFVSVQRFRPALIVACASIVVVEYLAWITDLQRGWGITNGPELGLWSLVVAVLLVARNVPTD
jgi:glycerol-3-phosphate acyltransferase PlsY